MDGLGSLGTLVSTSYDIYNIWKECNNSIQEVADMQADMEMIVDFIKEYARLFEMLQLPEQEARRDHEIIRQCQEKARKVWTLLHEVHSDLHGKSLRNKAAQQYELIKRDKLGRIRQLLRDLQSYVNTGIAILNAKIGMANRIQRRGTILVDKGNGEAPKRKVDLTALSKVDTTEVIRSQYADLYEELNDESELGVWAIKDKSSPPTRSIRSAREEYTYSNTGSYTHTNTQMVANMETPPAQSTPNSNAPIVAVSSVTTTSTEIETPPPYIKPEERGCANPISEQTAAYNSTPRGLVSDAPSNWSKQPTLIKETEKVEVLTRTISSSSQSSTSSQRPRASLWYDDDEFDEWA